jgi:hypothetical protein
MKGLVLMSFLTVSPGHAPVANPIEFYDNQAQCDSRMAELRNRHGDSDKLKCKCHRVVAPIAAEGNDAI